jgi:hypothetical protein
MINTYDVEKRIESLTLNRSMIHLNCKKMYDDFMSRLSLYDEEEGNDFHIGIIESRTAEFNANIKLTIGKIDKELEKLYDVLDNDTRKLEEQLYSL